MKCVMSTADTFYIPGQNHRCGSFGAYTPPGELSKYFSGLVCKAHRTYLNQNYEVWMKAFRERRVPLNADNNQFKENAETDETIEKLTGKYLT